MKKHSLMIVQDQLDMDLMAQSELTRLKRQYRIMEGDRKAFFDEIHSKLEKQKKLIETLQMERDNLLTDLKVATSKFHRKKYEKFSLNLQLLLRNYREICGKVTKEKENLMEIDLQIRKIEKQVFKLKINDVSDKDFEERLTSGQKSVKLLENKLETVIKRFCTILMDNKNLRLEIDNLLKERKQFNLIWEKLLLNLEMGKKTIMELVEQAILAYDQREESCSKLDALKLRAQNDNFLHTQEMREMQLQLNQDGKLREFLTIKGQKRVMKDLEEKEERHQEELQKNEEKQKEIYEEILRKIQEICGENEIHRISTNFLKQEEENFALFNYVNEVNHELEQLNQTISDVKEKIKIQKQICQERMEKQKETVESLTLKLQESTNLVNEEQILLKQREFILEQVLDGINRIFQLLNCNLAPILKLLGTNNVINNDNVMVYLNLIEKKVSTIVTNVYFREKSLYKMRKLRGPLYEEKQQ